MPPSSAGVFAFMANRCYFTPMNTYKVVGCRVAISPSTGLEYEVQDVFGHVEAADITELKRKAAAAGVRLVHIENVTAKWARQERGYERARA